MSSHEYETSTNGGGGGGGEFNPIDELDPSLCNGFRVIYDREVRVTSALCLLCPMNSLPLTVGSYGNSSSLSW